MFPMARALEMALPGLQEVLSRQVVVLFGIGFLVLVVTLAVVLTMILKSPKPISFGEPEPEAPEPERPPPGVDGTLAILPGRFLVEEDDVDVELRLVKTTNSDRQETTIGREPGKIYRHVQLRAASVSAKHATLICENGRYTIVNQSRTNPTRVNGEPLGADASRRLVHLDRIEIGEVAMTYHAS